MIYNRDTVIDRINELKRKSGKWGSGTRVTNKSIAEHLGVSERTVSDWLQKRPYYIPEDGSGFPDIPLKYLVELSNLFKCDINHLLDENFVCKTKEATDICSQTGLSEEAVYILRDKSIKRNDLIREYIDFLTKDANSNDSLSYRIVRFMARYKMPENKYFSEIAPFYEKVIKPADEIHDPYKIPRLLERIEAQDMIIRDHFIRKGYSQEQIDQIEEETDGFFEDYFISQVAEEFELNNLKYEANRYIDTYLKGAE